MQTCGRGTHCPNSAARLSPALQQAQSAPVWSATVQRRRADSRQICSDFFAGWIEPGLWGSFLPGRAVLLVCLQTLTSMKVFHPGYEPLRPDPSKRPWDGMAPWIPESPPDIWFLKTPELITVPALLLFSSGWRDKGTEHSLGTEVIRWGLGHLYLVGWCRRTFICCHSTFTGRNRNLSLQPRGKFGSLCLWVYDVTKHLTLHEEKTWFVGKWMVLTIDMFFSFMKLRLLPKILRKCLKKWIRTRTCFPKHFRRMVITVMLLKTLWDVFWEGYPC